MNNRPTFPFFEAVQAIRQSIEVTRDNMNQLQYLHRQFVSAENEGKHKFNNNRVLQIHSLEHQ